MKITFASLTLALAMPAMAQQALTTDWVNLRAGPGRDYPLVGRLVPNTPVQVGGCLGGYNWCDVIVGPDRGWVYASHLSYVYQNRPVPILGWGAQIGLPVVVFSIDSYWDQYYRQRPWYSQRPRWEHVHPPIYRPHPPSPPGHLPKPPPSHVRPPGPPPRPPQAGPMPRPPKGQQPAHPPEKPAAGPPARPPGQAGQRPGGDRDSRDNKR